MSPQKVEGYRVGWSGKTCERGDWAQEEENESFLSISDRIKEQVNHKKAITLTLTQSERDKV